MDARATPVIAAWLVIGTILLWGRRADRPLAWNIASVALSVAFMVSAYLAVTWLRGRRRFERPQKWDFGDIVLFGVLPAVPAGLVRGSPESALNAAVWTFTAVGVIYVVIGFGLLEIGAWAIGRIRVQLVHIVALVARTLPMLLILVVFLMFAAEIWESAHSLRTVELAVVLGLLLLVAVLLIITTLRAEVRRIESRGDWDGMLAEARDSPAAPLVNAMPPERPALPPLTWLQRANLGLLILVSQLLQSVFVAAMVTAFLVALGLVALPASVQEGWVGEPVAAVAQFELLGEMRTLSGELLTVAAMLGGIVGLYFTGLALTDPAYRAEYFARVIAEVQQIASVGAVYLAADRESRA